MYSCFLGIKQDAHGGLAIRPLLQSNKQQNKSSTKQLSNGEEREIYYTESPIVQVYNHYLNTIFQQWQDNKKVAWQ